MNLVWIKIWTAHHPVCGAHENQLGCQDSRWFAARRSSVIASLVHRSVEPMTVWCIFPFQWPKSKKTHYYDISEQKLCDNQMPKTNTVYLCIYIYIYVCVYVFSLIYIYIYLSIYVVYIHTPMYTLNVYVPIYVYIHIIDIYYRYIT